MVADNCSHPSLRYF